MIKNFRDKATARLYRGDTVKQFGKFGQAALRKLDMLDAAQTLEDLRSPPGNRLEALRGVRDGQYSIRISSQWRICFRWEDGAAHDVEIVDYH